MKKNAKIYIAGHTGLVGSSILRRLKNDGFQNVITRTRSELNLLDQSAVDKFFEETKPEYVVLAAARVGGIQANSTYPADFIYENLVIASNIIHAAAKTEVSKLVYLGSSCIYPKNAPQPMKEEYLLTGPLEPTNEAYAIAKIAGLKLCEYYHRQYGHRFISVMPTNLYGPNDNFHPTNSHVIPGMLRRFHEARMKKSPTVLVWGTGRAKREFLHVDDLVDALLVIMQKYESPEIINIGSAEEVTIAELSEIMKTATGFSGRITFDLSKPDGPGRKLLDIEKLLALGWKPRITLRDGLKDVYQWANDNAIFETPLKTAA